MALRLSRLPAVVPTHWNAQSQVDHYGSRWTYLLFAAMPAALSLGYLLCCHHTRGSAPARRNRGVEQKIIPALIFFSSRFPGC
ncbi:MAG: DUF1648 domain-containing protein [Oscillospiraceae bacterium]|nr:DUF1648 domain-containing protein [Oscillospiraceae bacterium]